MMLNRTERASGPVLRRYAPVLVVTLLGLVLRLLTITGRPLWFDEFGQIEAASLPLGEMLERIRSHAAAAPLDYFGTRLMLVFGETYAVRLWPALIGTAAIPLLYLAGRKWFGERVGLLAALLLAVAPFHVYYSTEARFYALSAFMAVLCLVTFRTRWFALAVALTLYTHYFAVLVPLGLVVIYRHQAWRGGVDAVGGVRPADADGLPAPAGVDGRAVNSPDPRARGASDRVARVVGCSDLPARRVPALARARTDAMDGPCSHRIDRPRHLPRGLLLVAATGHLRPAATVPGRGLRPS
jgi:hypothetical protein